MDEIEAKVQRSSARSDARDDESPSSRSGRNARHQRRVRQCTPLRIPPESAVAPRILGTHPRCAGFAHDGPQALAAFSHESLDRSRIVARK